MMTFVCASEKIAPEDEKVLGANEVNIYITPEQAALIVLALNRAMEAHKRDSQAPDSR